jgi:hypothetical protein
MTQPRATDYRIDPQIARDILGIVTVPADIRREVLCWFRDKYGNEALLDLFAQFIGMANSVAENSREAVETLLVTEGGMQPHEAEKVNLPTMFGALSGILLTEGVDQAKTCGGCAFRLGTWANQSPSTTYDADWCSNPGEDDFHCHENLDVGGNPTRKCTGFTQFRRHRSRTTSACPAPVPSIGDAEAVAVPCKRNDGSPASLRRNSACTDAALPAATASSSSPEGLRGAGREHRKGSE